MPAVLFDMDGVLIDSFEAHLKSWLDLAAETGATFTREDFDREFGRTSREMIGRYWGEHLSADEIAELDDRKELLFREDISRNFPLMDGVVELLDSLAAAGYPLAVGSSGPPENVALTLSKLGEHRFGAVITAGQVTRGKPDPQVFQLGAAGLGVPAEQCVVVEDARPGVEAAHAAGMACIGLVSTGRTREQLVDAELVVESLREITPAVIAKLVAR